MNVLAVLDGRVVPRRIPRVQPDTAARRLVRELYRPATMLTAMGSQHLERAEPPVVPGLPDRIQACLFDLDGVLTQTAKVAGVAAGRAGAFGWVVGVDRVGQADALRRHGADAVVDDLAELLEEP